MVLAGGAMYVFGIERRDEQVIESTPEMPIVVFADGAAKGNPGPGGWGAILVTPSSHELLLTNVTVTGNRARQGGGSGCSSRCK